MNTCKYCVGYDVGVSVSCEGGVRSESVHHRKQEVGSELVQSQSSGCK